MKISDLFMGLNKYPDWDSCQPILDTDINPDKLNKLRNYLGEALDYIYVSSNAVPPYFYQRDFVFIHIWDLALPSLEMLKIKELINQMHERMNAAIRKNDYKQVFHLIEKKARIPMYIKHFSSLPDEQKYDIFRYVYESSEYGFHLLTAEFLSHVYSYCHLSEQWKQSMDLLKRKCSNHDHVIVYRGENSLSAPIDQAYSWTLSRQIAQFFATRFTETGFIYKSKVHISDILDYLPKEEEVIILPHFITKYEKDMVKNK